MKRNHLRGLENNLALDIILITGKLCRKATNEVIRFAPPKGFDTDNTSILQELSGFVVEIAIPILELHDALFCLSSTNEFMGEHFVEGACYLFEES
jgi:hypothetical protein